MAKYRKKPIPVEATQITADMVIDNTLPKGVTRKSVSFMEEPRQLLDYKLIVRTLEGEALNAQVGDYIVIGVKGEVWPVRKDIFEETYERIDENKEYKNPVCKGSVMFGTACGRCERCEEEMYGKSAEHKN